MTRIKSVKRALSVVPVLGALAFGAAQAFASPAAPTAERACTWFECAKVCEPGGGVCGNNGYCICY